jgi:hypothetical protein
MDFTVTLGLTAGGAAETWPLALQTVAAKTAANGNAIFMIVR